MKTEVSMRDPARHHFGELLGQFWLHFGHHLAPQVVPKRVQSASRALPEAIRDAFWRSLGVSSGAPACPWAVLERSAPSRGYPQTPLGIILKGFCKDSEVSYAVTYGKGRRHSALVKKMTPFPPTNATRCCAHMP